MSITVEQFWQRVDEIIDQKIQKKLEESGIYDTFLDGKVVSVSGSYANVQLNGNTTYTVNIPVNPSITVAAGNEVKVVNFAVNGKRDYMVLCKKV